ncbi:Multidrug resistance protein MdtA [Acaryochloris thomasi RCC1774]|uniref:Multidrug resistance protein MdtA n=1 Tax=Acaryochloris thomasi RCC1774 TaxID=1764569 RepID=A0A2W1JY68_9CYAN|nr:efflux RND transporter periplasmic adaptor subunit [Acaryochloris thomasi]PZD73187.1 Multidrug resistance protein MdtA [Acaryochloris thomasi RCC1774]
MIAEHKLKSFSLLLSVIALSTSSILGGCGGKKEAQQPKAIAVKLATIESDTHVNSSEFIGTSTARDRVSLAPRIDGRIIEIFVRQGQRVRKGDKIVRLEPTQAQENVNAANQSVNVERATLGQALAELRTAQANRAVAAAQVKSAKADLENLGAEVELAQINMGRAKMLVKEGVQPQQNLDDANRDLKTNIAQRNSRQEALNAAVESLEASDRQVDQARASIASQKAAVSRSAAELKSVGQNLAFNTISAPIDGVIGSFDEKKVGDYVSIGEQLTTLTNNQDLELNINIPIENRDRLQRGLATETIEDGETSSIKGTISYVAPLVQQNAQSILAKVTFPSQSRLRDREYVRVRVIWDQNPGILVPTTAISTLGGQSFVYVAKEQKSEAGEATLVAQQQPIKLGKIQNQAYQILSGVQVGDRIATSNILSLKDSTPITEAETVGSLEAGEGQQQSN